MCVCVCWGCGGHCRRNKILLCFAYQHIILTLSIFCQFLNNISFTGGPEEAQGGQHGGGAVQPHEVPPLHRDVEEGGDRGLVKVFEQQGREKGPDPLQHFQHGGQVLLQLYQQGDGHGGQVLLRHLLLS